MDFSSCFELVAAVKPSLGIEEGQHLDQVLNLLCGFL